MQTPQIISILIGVLVIAVGLSLMGRGTKKLKLAERLNNTSDAEIQAILRESVTSNTKYGQFYGSYIKPYFDRNPVLFEKLIKMLGIDLDKIEQKIREAKMEKQITKEEIASMKMLGTAGAIMFFLLGAGLSNTAFILLGILSYLLGGFVPIAVLDQKIKQRKEAIEKELPDFLDLLKSVTEAGLVIQEAIVKITERMNTPLAEEFKMVMAETKANGGQWRVAMENMAFRNNIDSLSDVVSDILISYEKGTSITETLEKEANAMRQLRNFKCQERAKGLSVKLIIPMAIFSFFPLLILLLAPMLIEMVRSMG